MEFFHVYTNKNKIEFNFPNHHRVSPLVFYIQITNLSVNGVHIWLGDDRKYHCDGGKLLSIADRWTHVVVSKLDSRSSYQLCIDGQHLSTLSRHDMSLIKADQHIIAPQNIIIFRRFDKSAYGTPNKVRIANLIAFKRCLTLVEIRAIHQQQTSIEQIKVGTYITSNKTHSRSVNYHRNSDYFSYKFILLRFLVFLIVLICYCSQIYKSYRYNTNKYVVSH